LRRGPRTDPCGTEQTWSTRNTDDLLEPCTAVRHGECQIDTRFTTVTDGIKSRRQKYGDTEIEN